MAPQVGLEPSILKTSDRSFSMRESRSWDQSDFVQQFESNEVEQRSKLHCEIQVQMYLSA